MKNDRYQQYYTNSEPIVGYMINRLQPDTRDRILEPCAGDGVFIDSLLQRNVDFSLDAFDLDPEAYSTLRNKFAQYPEIRVALKDTLLETSPAQFDKRYDRVVGNPPYGAWQDYERRDLLKQLYPDVYVKETYTLFLHRCIDLLKPNGRLVFIIPNTFLNLHRHTTLRQKILLETQLEEVVIFPSKFFPDVNYGYAQMCIVTLRKLDDSQSYRRQKVRVFADLEAPEDLTQIKTGNWEGMDFNYYELNQEDIYNNPDHALFLNPYPYILETLSSPGETVGDIAICVTGFYSGNDKKYLRRGSDDVRGKNRYAVVKQSQVCNDPREHAKILEGIDSGQCFIPVVKGGATRYLKPDDWYMDWSRQAVSEYRSSPKARFQNAQCYFKTGIAVPMVSSVPISGALLERKLFDQSIVGVFPEDENLLLFLLAFFNSEVCGELISTINPTANNSANYIKKIPVVIPGELVLEQVDNLIQKILDQIRSTKTFDQEIREELDKIFWGLFRERAVNDN